MTFNLFFEAFDYDYPRIDLKMIFTLTESLLSCAEDRLCKNRVVLKKFT